MKYFLSAFIISFFTFTSFAEKNKATYLLKHYRNLIKGFYSPTQAHPAPAHPVLPNLAQANTNQANTNQAHPVQPNIAVKDKEMESLSKSIVFLVTTKEETHIPKESPSIIKKRKILKGQSTGFFIRPNLLVTNLHSVINNPQSSTKAIRFRHANGKWEPIKKIKFISLALDLALLETESPGVPLELADPSDKIQNNSLAYTVGFLDSKMVKRKWNLMKIIDEKIFLSGLFIQPKLPGLSGSPLLNKEGKVIGVLTLGSIFGDKGEPKSIVSSAIPKASDLRTLLKQDSLNDIPVNEVNQWLQSEISVLEDKANWVWDKETQAQAQYQLTQIYTEESKKIIEFRHSSAEKEYLSALLTLGHFYYIKGIKPFYKLLEEKSRYGAQSLTGAEYQSMKTNYRKAYYLWEKAALKGHPEAQYRIGYMIYKGKLVNDRDSPYPLIEKDRGSVYWIKLAAEQGHPLAQILLGKWYFSGLNVTEQGFVPKDMAKAEALWETVAEKGHPEAQYLLGALYKHYAKNSKYIKGKRAIKKASYWISKANSQMPKKPVIQNAKKEKKDQKEPRCQNTFKQ